MTRCAGDDRDEAATVDVDVNESVPTAVDQPPPQDDEINHCGASGTVWAPTAIKDITS
jgi:hypothetical protein